jgi:hypothetical protein
VRTSNGHISQRHGNRNLYYGNWVLGGGTGGSAGIRVFGGDHKIFNNYIEGVTTFGILLEGGTNTDMTGMLTDHKEVYNATVAFNTVLSGGIVLGGSHPLGPINSTVAYNVVKGSISEMGGSMGTKYIGNIATGGGGMAMNVDPKLVMMGEVFIPGPGSPVINAATMAIQLFPYVTEDITGKPRMNPDIGSYEVSEAAGPYGPLTQADVGPMAP